VQLIAGHLNAVRGCSLRSLYPVHSGSAIKKQMSNAYHADKEEVVIHPDLPDGDDTCRTLLTFLGGRVGDTPAMGVEEADSALDILAEGEGCPQLQVQPEFLMPK
jgi:hypothetical protein